MKRKYLAWRGFMVLLGVLVVSCPLVPANSDFSDEDKAFLSSGFQDATQSEVRLSNKSKWSLSLGGGYSFISPYYADIPDFWTFIGKLYNYPFLNTGVTFRRKLGPAGVFEGSLMRRLTPWASVGVLGGVSSTYTVAIDQDESLGLAPGTLPFQFQIRANLQVAKAMPALQMGPWIRIGRFPFRPYATAGLGWYEVNQAIRYTTLGGFGIQINSRTDEYLGATTGGGLMMGISENGTIGLECRYERIFSPGQKIEFVSPMAHFSYTF